MYRGAIFTATSSAVAGPFSVPPGLQADRWILLNTRNRDARPDALKIKLTRQDGAETTLLLGVNSHPQAATTGH